MTTTPTGAPPPKPEKITAHAICNYLRTTYTEAQGYVCMFEVANGTGSNAKRYADALVLNLWQSRGMDLSGYEVKVARSDWLNELKAPEKAWPVMQFCDRWWLIAAPGVAKLDEVPSNWGFVECDGIRMKVKKPAPKLDAAPITRSFMGAMMRRPAREQEGVIEIEVRKRMAALEVDFRERVKREAGGMTKHAENIVETAKRIKDATGVDLTQRYNDEDFAGAIKVALNGANVMHAWRGLPSVKNRLEAALRDVDRLLEQTPEGGAGA